MCMYACCSSAASYWQQRLECQLPAIQCVAADKQASGPGHEASVPFTLPCLIKLLLVVAGTLLTILSLVLVGISKPHVLNALAPASVILGLAGMTFHLSQLHISSLFPRRKGLVASLLVAGFTGCGIVFWVLLQISTGG